MARKPYTPYAEYEGQLYVHVRAVMSPICAIVDGLRVVYFTDKRGRPGSKPYLPIDVAIDWCEKEMQHHSREKYEKMIAAMRTAKARLSEESNPAMPQPAPPTGLDSPTSGGGA